MRFANDAPAFADLPSKLQGLLKKTPEHLHLYFGPNGLIPWSAEGILDAITPYISGHHRGADLPDGELLAAWVSEKKLRGGIEQLSEVPADRLQVPDRPSGAITPEEALAAILDEGFDTAPELEPLRSSWVAAKKHHLKPVFPPYRTLDLDAIDAQWREEAERTEAERRRQQRAVKARNEQMERDSADARKTLQRLREERQAKAAAEEAEAGADAGTGVVSNKGRKQGPKATYSVKQDNAVWSMYKGGRYRGYQAFLDAEGANVPEKYRNWEAIQRLKWRQQQRNKS